MRKVFMGACVVSMVSLSMAQHLEIAVDGGFGSGVGSALVGRNIEYDLNWARTKYEQVYVSGGNGTKITGEVAYYFNENVGIIASSGYSMKEEYTARYKDPAGSSTMTGTTSYLPINVGLKFRVKTGIMGIHILPYVYMAPGLYLPKKTVDSVSSLDTTERTFTYDKGFGFSAGVGAEIILPFLADRVGIKVEFSPTYAFANPTKYTEKITSASGTTSTTYTYKNDTAPEKLKAGEVADQPHDSYCSMVVRAGLCFKIF
jgi:hypothetical protein